MEKDYEVIASGKGFRLRIARPGEFLGIVEVDGLTFPEYRDRYINMALTIRSGRQKDLI